MLESLLRPFLSRRRAPNQTPESGATRSETDTEPEQERLAGQAHARLRQAFLENESFLRYCASLGLEPAGVVNNFVTKAKHQTGYAVIQVGGNSQMRPRFQVDIYLKASPDRQVQMVGPYNGYQTEYFSLDQAERALAGLESSVKTYSWNAPAQEAA